MIVFFDLAPDCLRAVDTALLEDRMSLMLRAHREGDHFLLIERNLGSWLLENITLIERDKSTLRRINSQMTQYGSLKSDAYRWIKVGQPCSHIFFDQKSRALTVPIDCIHWPQLLRKTVLVVEDAVNDANLLKALFPFIGGNAPSGPMAFEAQHGGGTRLGEITRRCLDEGRIVVALVDSDSQTPIAHANMLKNALAKKGLQEDPRLFFFVLPCHEIENVIDLQVLSFINSTKSSPTYSLLLKISAQENIGEDFFVTFFDMKAGLSSRTIAAMSEAERSWIERKLALGNTQMPPPDIPGFGKKIVDEVLQSGRCLASLSSMARSSNWKAVFEEFFSNLMWLFIAPPPQRT